jgi:FKBP-type peptidyl-prolyl cis-trans isomerase SlyD
VSQVPVARDTVVTLRIELHDAQGTLLESPAEPLTYLHGGYGGMLAALERALEGKLPGETLHIQLEPEQAFGAYDAALLRVEPAERYGEGLEAGMQIEEDARFYTVTDVAEGSVVLDGNHPLAGMALRFICTVMAVRPATKEERSRGVSLP